MSTDFLVNVKGCAVGSGEEGNAENYLSRKMTDVSVKFNPNEPCHAKIGLTSFVFVIINHEEGEIRGRPLRKLYIHKWPSRKYLHARAQH